MRLDVPQISNTPIGFAGAGRIAQALGALLRERGQRVTAIAARSPERTHTAAQFIGPDVRPVSVQELPRFAKRVIIAVPDDAIEEVVRELAGAGMRDGVVLHTSGAKGVDVLGVLAANGVECGTLHPLQTVASPLQGVAKLPGVSFAVDGSPIAAAWAEQIIHLLGGYVLRIPVELRPLYHVAAVMASNYVVGLLDAAVSLMRAAGVDESAALHALAPLASTAVENAVAKGPVAALTGPIQRGDYRTIAVHLEALRSAPASVSELYRSAGMHLIGVARRSGLTEPEASRLESMLQEIGGAVV